MKQQINYDIAWQIFDEVNMYFDIERYIDLNCLDLIDAQAITKQKLLDISQLAVKQLKSRNKSKVDGECIILII